MFKANVTTFRATDITWTVTGGSPVSFGRIGGVKRVIEPAPGGRNPGGVEEPLGYQVLTSFIFKNPDLELAWENLANWQGKAGLVQITRHDGQINEYEAYFNWKVEQDFNGRASQFAIVFRSIMNANDLMNLADRDASIIYSLTKLQHDMSLETIETSKTITSINASTSPYTTATVTTSTAHGYSVGQFVTIAGNAQADYNGVYAINSVPSATTFTISVPVATPTSGAGGTCIRSSRRFYFRADWKVVVYSDFTVNVFLKNFLPYDQPSDFTWQGWSSWKSAAATWSVYGASDNADAEIAVEGFGEDGFSLNTSGVDDYPAFSIATDADYQLFATLQSDSNWEDMFS